MAKRNGNLKTLLIGGTILGGLGLAWWYAKPASERVKPGDKVLVGYNMQGINLQTKMLVSSTSKKEVTGNLYEQPGNPSITVPRSNVLKFT